MLEEVTPVTENPVSASRPLARKMRGWFFELGLALLLTLFFAREFVAQMATKTLTDGSDIYENLWNYWQWRLNFFEHFTNPYFTDYVYYPTGVNLYLHPFQPLVSFQAVAGQAIFGQIFGANLVILLALTLAIWGAYRLFLYISNHVLGAWLGAIVFIWCNPWQWDFFLSGQVNLISVQWLPLYVLCLLQAFDQTSGRRQWLWTALATLCLLACALTDFYYTLHLVILTGLTVLFYLVVRCKSWPARGLVFGKAALIGGVWGVLLSPLLYNMLEQSRDRNWYVPSQSQTVLRSVDLLSFFIPNGQNPLYGGLVRNSNGPLYTGYNPSGIVGAFNPGYLPLILAGFAVFCGIRFKSVRFGLWSWLGVCFAVLAMGPYLRFNGQVIEAIRLPYGFLYNLPGLSTTRDPSNFSVPYLLAIGALTALGTSELLRRVTAKWPVGLAFNRLKITPAWAVSALLLVLVSLEFCLLPVTMNIDPVPEFYKQLAADKEDYAILEVPAHVQEGGLEHERMFYQTFHGKKLLGGQLARDHKRLSPTDFLTHSPFFPEAMLNDSQTPPTERDMLNRPRFPEMSAALLGYFKFRYIVVYPQAIKPEQQAALQNFLSRALGPNPTPLYKDSIITVYKTPPVPSALPQIVTEVGQAWFRPDTANDQTWRWGQFGQSAEIYLTNLTAKPLKTRLEFYSFSYAVPRDLRLTLNYEKDIANLRLPASPPGQARDEQKVTIEVELKPGNNILTFYTFQQPIIPIDYTKGGDPDRRKLSYAIRDFKATPL